MPLDTSSQKASRHLSLGVSSFSQSFQGTAIPPPAARQSQVQPPSAAPEPTSTLPPINPKPFIRRKPIRQLTPPRSPSIQQSSTSLHGSRGHSPAGIGGPLSSHPVTPIESQETEIFPPHPHDQGMMADSGTNGNGNHVGTNGTTQKHITGDSSDSNNFDPSLPQQPVNDTSRRPSFVSRFLRLRSDSFMRSKSQLGKGGSTTSLNQKENGTGSAAPSFIAKSERGTKRPGSPMVNRSATAGATSQTFPRMMRKKSMELLSTARRKSGMFGRDDDMIQSAVDEEHAREKAREEYENGFNNVIKEADDRRSEEQRLLVERDRVEQQRRYEELRKRDPAPVIQLDGLTELDGEDMFRDIGKS